MASQARHSVSQPEIALVRLAFTAQGGPPLAQRLVEAKVATSVLGTRVTSLGGRATRCAFWARVWGAAGVSPCQAKAIARIRTSTPLKTAFPESGSRSFSSNSAFRLTPGRCAATES